MPGMRNNDRKTQSQRNEDKNPLRSKKPDPGMTYPELQQKVLHLRSNNEELNKELKEKSKIIEEVSSQMTIFQSKSQDFESKINQLASRVQENHQLFSQAQKQYEQITHLYQIEQLRAQELLAKYEEANAERSKYLSLYNDVQDQLKYERRSKAGIKGWETRRKRENERLKQEIREMTILLRDSLERKDTAIKDLYVFAERMDRIQELMDSVEEESDGNFFTFPQKLKRIWFAIKDILSE